MSGARCAKVASCRPCLIFLVPIEWIMDKTIGNNRRGIMWTLTSLLQGLDFADDVALVSFTRNQLQRKRLADLSLAPKQLGFNISRKKTKPLQLTDTPLPVELEKEDLEEVEKFTYLGSIMCKSSATIKDITNRLQKAKSSFVQQNKVWRFPNVSKKQNKDLKQRLITTTAWRRSWRVTQRDS